MTPTNSTNETQTTLRDETLKYPFPFADHSLACPVIYDQVRQECPVAHVQMPFGGDAFLLTRHEDVVKAWSDPKCGIIQSSDGDVPRIEVEQTVGSGGDQESLFSVSDARHNKTRRLITQAFTVKAANALVPRVVELTNTLVDAMEQAGPPADLFEDYAIQTPMAVICEMLGVPGKDELQFRKWGNALISTTISAQELQAEQMKMGVYLYPLIERERQQPSDTVLGTLVKAFEQGDEVITQQELLSLAGGIIAAGFETVSTTFTNSAFLLLQRPELIAQLRERLDDPMRMASAIEEILRITPIGLGGRPRIARADVTLSGTTMQTGSVLMLDVLAANNDESVFPAAREIKFDREANPMVSFGRGIHACLGQQVARMELRVLWTTLLRRLPNIRLAVTPEEVPWRPNNSATFGPAHLPVIWN
jgi:cytochrome P450